LASILRDLVDKTYISPGGRACVKDTHEQTS
jgi:hypothetical protein